MRKVFLIIVYLFASLYISQAQELLGIVNSNYAGIYGIGLNPSSMVNSKLYMDYNLFGAGFSLDNNYLYINRQDLYGWLFKNETPIYYTSEGESRNLAMYRDKENKWGYNGIRLSGPGGMVVYGKHAFGFTTAYRSNSSFHNLPPDIAFFLYEAIDYDKQHGILYNHSDNIRMASLTWMELGFSYAYNFRRYKWESWSAGITIKPLFANMGFYSNIYDVIYEVHNDDSASVYNANFDFAYSVPIDYNTNDFPDKPIFNGFGFGVDIGITYLKTHRGHSNMVITRLCEQEFEDYNYKIGFSILDIGYVKFKKKAYWKSFSETHTEWYKPDDILPDSTLNTISQKIDYYFESNAEATESNDNFTMNLPPAISLQFEYAPRKYLFLNSTLIYGFVLGKSYIKRPSILEIAPRYETARLEVAIPISIYEWNWSRPRVGLSFRYGNFFVGFDKLNAVFGMNDLTGVDFYFGLRLNLSNNFRLNFIKGYCGRQKLRNIETFDYRNF